MYYLTTKQIAETIGVTLCRVRQLAMHRKIEPIRAGGLLLWRKDSLKQFKRREVGRPRTKK